MNTLREHFAQKREEALRDYFTFLSFPSVSTDPAYQVHILACADWLQRRIGDLGFKTERWTNAGHPVLFASHMEAGSDKPTLLIYNHYDVQPVDPEGAWTTPPFQPTERQGQIYARGAQDNKGQCFYVYLALKGLLERTKKLPINVKWIIEGEEECGSVALAEHLKDPDKQKKLKADYLAIVDMGMPSAETPAVTLGVRGIVTMEYKVRGSTGDLHSGSYGGMAYNPLHAMVEVLSQLRDADGRVTIPGFYEDVAELSAADKKIIDFERDLQKSLECLVGEPLGGEHKKYRPTERAWIRPTLEINGIAGGYGGAGFKTVLPAEAIAKISCRLVPHQDPEKISRSVAEYLLKLTPPGVKGSVEIYPGHSTACRVNPNSKVVTAFAQAYEELFQKPCIRTFSGGSIPIASQLTEVSGSEVMLMGFGLSDDQIHAPNEHFGIDRLEKGFCVMTRALEILGAK